MNSILTTADKATMLLKIQTNAFRMMVLARAISAAAYCIIQEEANAGSVTGGDRDIIACPTVYKCDIISLLDIMGELETDINKAAEELDQELIPG